MRKKSATGRKNNNFQVTSNFWSLAWTYARKSLLKNFPGYKENIMKFIISGITSEVWPGPHQKYKMESFATIKLLIVTAELFIIDIGGSKLRL